MTKLKGPADSNQRAVLIAKIATGEIEDAADLKGKNAAAVLLAKLDGAKGGPARAKSLSAKRRSEIRLLSRVSATGSCINIKLLRDPAHPGKTRLSYLLNALSWLSHNACEKQG